MKNDDYMNVTYDTPNESDNFQFPINPDDPNPFKEVPADRTDGNFKSLMSDDMRATYLNDEINKLDSGEESPFDENGEYRNNTNMTPIVSVVEQPKKKFSFNFFNGGIGLELILLTISLLISSSSFILTQF